ncbi:MAG: hypothetical protein IJ104_02890 [Methanobrevibacter sp.]|nr:hypothetical protein [Methanobrevibacter sp.]
MNIQGSYTFKIPVTTMFLNTELLIENHNIITDRGESFFLNRCINDAFNPIQYIVIGNGNKAPRRTDTKLGNERNRKKCSCRADVLNKRLVLTANFTAKEIQETTEIGVITTNNNSDDILISHDVYNKIDKSVFSGITGEVIVEYIYQFTTSFQKNAWLLADETNNVYYAHEENNVIRVFENNSGYRLVSTLDELRNVPGAFFYDSVSKNIYIKPFGDLNSSDIIIQV